MWATAVLTDRDDGLLAAAGHLQGPGVLHYLLVSGHFQLFFGLPLVVPELWSPSDIGVGRLIGIRVCTVFFIVQILEDESVRLWLPVGISDCGREGPSVPGPPLSEQSLDVMMLMLRRTDVRV